MLPINRVLLIIDQASERGIASMSDSAAALDLLATGLLSQRIAGAWVVSDLQQREPEQARRCLMTAVADVRALGRPFDRIWHLGDAVEGEDCEHLERMAAMQVEAFASFGVPLLFVPGNHDFDWYRSGGQDAVFRRAVLQMPGWRTTAQLDDVLITDTLATHRIFAFADHADPAGRWWAREGSPAGAIEHYPHHDATYASITMALRNDPRPVITLSHYAFPGGTRPAGFLARLLPLPTQVRLHLHGHAHIGDRVWGGKDALRRIAGIDDHDALQVNVASLEDRRGSSIRSAFLDILADGSLAVLFRDHSARRWTDMVCTGPQPIVATVPG